MWYALHNGSDGALCSTNDGFTANRQGVCSVTPLYPPCSLSNTEIPVM